MTEDEAKQKWCFRRGYIIDATVTPIDPDDPVKQIRCIGSACMAWRSLSDLHDGGFCGLAGKP